MSSRAARAVALAVLGAVAYAASMSGSLIGDDLGAIVENRVVTGHLPWTEALRRDFWGRARDLTGTFRPLVTLWFRLDWRLAGGAPWLFHAVSLALHAAVCAVGYLAFAAVANEAAALVGMALFAVLAAPSEAVELAAGRADLLGALLALLGLLAHSRGRSIAASAMLALGLASKESAIFAPAAWLLLGPTRERRVPRVVVWAGLIALAAVARTLALGHLAVPVVDLLRNPLRGVDPLARLFGAGRIFARLTLPGILDPSRRLYLCSAPACGPSGPDDPLAWFGLVAIALLLLAPVLLWRRSRAVALGLAWFDVFWFPVSNLALAANSVYGERLLYLPLLGLCVALAAAVLQLPVRWRRPALLLLLAFGLWNAAALQEQHGNWRSADTLYLSALAVAPDSALVQSNAAAARYHQKDAVGAELHARRALALWPDYPQAMAILASSLDRQGRPEEAQALFDRALASSGLDVDIAADAARFLVRRGRREEARVLLDRAQAAHPDRFSLQPLIEQIER